MRNFSHYDNEEITDYIAEYYPDEIDTELLSKVELFASDNKLISSESQLSDLFDSEIAPYVIDQYGENDQCAIDQAFNDWTDGLCTDGIIHPEQYSKYGYVGKFADNRRK